MYDLEIHLADRPGSLASMGLTLGKAGVSIEGGGAWTVNGKGIAHFLVKNGAAAESALRAAGINVAACNRVLILQLRQETPGQLGALTQLMADSGVNIDVLYSDHDHQLILIVDDYETGIQVSNKWASENNWRTSD